MLTRKFTSSGIKTVYLNNNIPKKLLSTTQVLFNEKPKSPFDKILIANRGEIACRIIKTCNKMGIKTVAIHSEADSNGLFVQMADESLCIGPPASADSYLQIERIINAVKMTGAQAVHPGFGFLSERNDFAAALEKNNVVFIGPRSYAIEVMGDKIMSKETAAKAKVNVIPGNNKVVKDADECVKIANEITYPVMVKASAGGGGKGMRIAYNDKECRNAFRLATNEAKSSFGDDRLFVEKFIEEPRHVEIQVLADKFGNVVHLNERECSIQRRNQKVFEEAPSPCVTDELRKKMGQQACSLAKAVEYITAGTCEFLVDKNRNFYFLEMNTRLQVEHPVTEYITGIDIVEQMINVAAGYELPFKQSDIPINGWAIEARVYAENPFKNFLPSIGTLTNYQEPFKSDTNIRIDSGIQENAEISVHYDPMISKTITYGKTREDALSKMRLTLDSYVIHGLTHNIPFLRTILDHPKFIKGDITTKFIEEEYPDGFSKDAIKLNDNDIDFLISTAASTYFNSRETFFINNKSNKIVLQSDLDNNKNIYEVEVYPDDDNGNEYEIFINGRNNEKPFTCVNSFSRGNFVFDSKVNDMKQRCQITNLTINSMVLQYRGLLYNFTLREPNEQYLNKFVPKPEIIDLDRVLLAPMPGNIFSINLKVGQQVYAGEEACIIEAMKMQNIFYVQKDGIVKNVFVKQGDTVKVDQKIYEIE